MHFKMRDISICSPHIYYEKSMQEFIRRRCNDDDKQWIYHMLDGMSEPDAKEVVYLNEPGWMLCKDMHQGSDFRMLVLFRDRSLKTIRDLRIEHVPLLRDMQAKVRQWLSATVATNQVAEYEIYFHYMPSVYQLHAHVSVPSQFYNSMRSHRLNHVIRNLCLDSLWYRNALIMFSVNKTIRQLHLYRSMNAETFVTVQPSTHKNTEGGGHSRLSVREWVRVKNEAPTKLHVPCVMPR